MTTPQHIVREPEAGGGRAGREGGGRRAFYLHRWCVGRGRRGGIVAVWTWAERASGRLSGKEGRRGIFSSLIGLIADALTKWAVGSEEDSHLLPYVLYPIYWLAAVRAEYN